VTPHIAITAPPTQANAINDAVSLTVVAHAPNNLSLFFIASNLPSGLTIGSTTGIISGTIGGTALVGSPYRVTVTASDGAYGDSQTFFWLVSHVVIVSPGTQASTTGDIVSVPVTARDHDGDTLTYSGTGFPAGLSISSATGLVSGTISAGAVGSYQTKVTASDGTNSNSQTLAWTVTGPMTLANPGTQTNANGDLVTLPTSASDPDGDPLTFSGTGIPAGLTINSATGLVTGTLGSTADANSPYTVTVTVSDATYTNTQAFTWNVNALSAIAVNDPGTQTNVNGDLVSLSVTAVNPFATVLTWSATGLPAGLTINPATGVITGTMTATADGASPYAVTVTATDGVNTPSDTFTWTVTHLTLTNPGNVGSAAGTAVSLTLQATDPDGDALTFSGTGIPAGLTLNSTSGVISGTPTAGVYGNSVVSVTASDGTHSASQSFLWSVAEVGLAKPADQTNTEANSVSLALSAQGPSGSTLTYTAANLPAGLNINSATGLISGTITAGAAVNGPYTVNISASDGTNSTSQGFTWTVNPKVSLTAAGDQTTTEGQSVALQIQASESGATLTYSGTGFPAGLALNGDGGTSRRAAVAAGSGR
jgi:hypothetical protein